MHMQINSYLGSIYANSVINHSFLRAISNFIYNLLSRVQGQIPKFHESIVLTNCKEESNEDKEERENEVRNRISLRWKPQVIIDKVDNEHKKPNRYSFHLFFFLKFKYQLPFFWLLSRVHWSFSCRVLLMRLKAMLIRRISPFITIKTRGLLISWICWHCIN